MGLLENIMFGDEAKEIAESIRRAEAARVGNFGYGAKFSAQDVNFFTHAFVSADITATTRVKPH